MKLKTAKPSTNYELTLPQDVREDYDGRPASYWLDGEPLLLQLSSYVRDQGVQVPANDRLKDRMSKDARIWTVWRTKIHPDQSLDQAAAEYTDDKGLVWVHAYLVWPHLAIYVTISGPEQLVRDLDNWALESLRSLRLTIN
jgi:hypothetical protein